MENSSKKNVCISCKDAKNNGKKYTFHSITKSNVTVYNTQVNIKYETMSASGTGTHFEVTGNISYDPNSIKDMEFFMCDECAKGIKKQSIIIASVLFTLSSVLLYSAFNFNINSGKEIAMILFGALSGIGTLYFVKAAFFISEEYIRDQYTRNPSKYLVENYLKNNEENKTVKTQIQKYLKSDKPVLITKKELNLLSKKGYTNKFKFIAEKAWNL